MNATALVTRNNNWIPSTFSTDRRYKKNKGTTRVFYADRKASLSPEKLLSVVACSLNMDTEDYKIRSRARSYTDLRFIGAFLLRTFCPAITLQQISVLFGQQDHTSVHNGIVRAAGFLSVGDDEFSSKYHLALKSVNEWLNNETSGYASAISA